MTETVLELVNNKKTKVAASYKILFGENQTIFKYQSSKGESKNKKKEKKETSRNERVSLEHWKTQVMTYAFFYPGC